MSEDMEVELQEDVLIEILARLPVKSLIRFTCVCKYWLSIITSPAFATKHYTTRDSDFDSVLATFFPACSISIISCENLTFETAFKFRPAVEYEPPRFGIYHRDIIHECAMYSPCNGLFLVYLRKAYESVILLWNPATREVYRLAIPNDFPLYCFFGIGFDNVTNDYKVVCFGGITSTNAKSTVVQLYSLAANTWNPVDDAGFNSEPDFHTCSSCTGRMYHWLAGKTEQHSLVSFDMVDDLFVETPLPHKTRYCNGFLNQYSNEDNTYTYPALYYMDDDTTSNCMHIWVLKEYGPTGFWNKIQCVTLPQVVSSRVQLMLWKEKAIVFSDYDEDDKDAVTWYNLTTQEIKRLQIPVQYTIVGYRESLVSIAKCVHQPPPTASSVGKDEDEDEDEDWSTEMTLLQQHNVDHQEDLQIQEHNEEGDDKDDDNSSTDSAFLKPEEEPYIDPGTVYIDYETDEKFRFRRKNEWEKLSKLPYCLREVNQPMITNPCTF